MKVLIAGSRSLNDIGLVENAVLASGFEVSEVVSGGARGIDTCAARWAKLHGKKLTVMLADWEEHGLKAGYMRNKTMVDYADATICIWDGKSKGTKHTINITKSAGKPVYVSEVFGGVK